MDRSGSAPRAVADPPSVVVTGSDAASAPLVLLHGTDGTEQDLLPFAERIAPGSLRLGVRGGVRTEGGFAFVRRHEDRRVHEQDLVPREAILAAFVERALAEHGGSGRPVVVGCSNGAIMAAALLLRRPAMLAGAILLRPLAPSAAGSAAPLDGLPVRMIEGAADARRGPQDG